MTAEERRARTESSDQLCRSAWQAAGGGASGLALVAVGGYGRRELAPYSDLDLVLVHDPAVEVNEVGRVAQSLWYPLWDAHVDLDHSVRCLDEATGAAAGDVRVALGLLDARHVAGDPAVTLRLRTELLTRWRRDARSNLPRLRSLVDARVGRVGELAHAAVPDLKSSYGGLRDAVVLKAMVATWLVDVPHVDLERSRVQLLDLRDVLHRCAGRGTDRVLPEYWACLGAALSGQSGETADSADSPGTAETAQRAVRRLGRRLVHLSRLTWSRVDHVLEEGAGTRRAKGRRPRDRAPSLSPVAPGVALSSGEVVLDRGADPAADPLLLLRAASVAAERGCMLAPASAARLAASSAPLPDPWPREARRLFVRLLASGPGLLAVWETLDETGAWHLLLPEWERIRLLPHASLVHRYTVDRHVIETCIESAALIRRVARPDLLCLAAVLHDIGKGGRADHAIAGEPVAAAVASRMGLAPQDAAVVARLVRWHLLLPETATTRDVRDPATALAVARTLQDRDTLDLLEVLTEADARATSPQAWTAWRAGLVRDLVVQARAAMVGGDLHDEFPAEDPPAVPFPEQVRRDPQHLHVSAAPGPHGEHLTVTVAGRDRVRFIAGVAGALAVSRATVRSARAWSVEGAAVTVWSVDDLPVAPTVLRQRIEAVLAGTLDPADRLSRSGSTGGTGPAAGSSPVLPPSVQVRTGVSTRSTVLEVRTEDRPGVVYLVCEALARLGLDVRSAHVATVGPQALDVFYIQGPGGVVLGEERAAAAVHAVRRSLEGAATLDA